MLERVAELPARRERAQQDRVVADARGGLGRLPGRPDDAPRERCAQAGASTGSVYRSSPRSGFQLYA